MTAGIARHSAARPCPVCGGHPKQPRGRQERCFGYISEDKRYAHCTREEYAGALQQSEGSSTYAHCLVGDCRCGMRHDAGPLEVDRPSPNGHGARTQMLYDYNDAAGNRLFQVVRQMPDPDDPRRKSFKQRRPDGKGGWIWNLRGVEPVLYRLPQVLEADPAESVCVVEGEKDANRLAQLGFVATTAPMGAGKWRPAHSESLRGRDVVLIGDNDQPGRAHVQAAARALHGVAGSVWTVELDGLAEGGDVSDWLDAGHTAEELRERIGNAQPWEPDSRQAEQDDCIVVWMSDVQPRQVQWLWRGYIPLGMLTLVVGDPDIGKTWALLDILARLTTGTPPPRETERPERATALLLMGEDSAEFTIRPRLDAQHADVRRIALWRGVRPDGPARLVQLQHDLGRAERTLRRTGANLFVVDGLNSYLGHTDGLNDVEVRQILMPLADMAERTGVAIVAIMHRNKGQHANPLHSVMGSVAFAAVARSVLAVAPDPAAPGRRVLVPIKSNLAERADGLGFRIADGVLYWDNDPVSVTAETVFAAPETAQQGDETGESRLDDAAHFLQTVLMQQGGRYPAKAIEREAKDAGLSWHTVRRAKDKLGVRSERDAFGEQGAWSWVLEARTGEDI